MKRTLVAAAAAAVLLAGCSSSPAPAASTSPAPVASSTPAATSSAPVVSETPTPEPSTSSAVGPIESAEDVVAATGCTGYELADEAAPFTATYGTCTWKGGRLQIYTFASDVDMASFFETVRAFGVTEKQTAVVGLVVAAPKSQKNLAALRAALGA